jgi:hypothetical protein
LQLSQAGRSFSPQHPFQRRPRPRPALSVTPIKSIVSESNHRRSLYFDKAKFDRSVHAKINCIECHRDANVDDFPHQPKLKPVQCDGCHAPEVKAYLISRHSATSKRPDLPGSTCIICHGKHDILPVTDPASPINPMNVPTTCGICHNEEASVPMGNGMARSISFTDAIHLRGLKRRGLKVTATCTSCHGAHAILPYNDQRSTISRKNSAVTCSKCHSQLESIHAKVIKAGLWRATATSYPVCVDCHDPHKGFEHEISRSEFSDRACMKCHGDSTVGSTRYRQGAGACPLVRHIKVQRTLMSPASSATSMFPSIKIPYARSRKSAVRIVPR